MTSRRYKTVRHNIVLCLPCCRVFRYSQYFTVAIKQYSYEKANEYDQELL